MSKSMVLIADNDADYRTSLLRILELEDYVVCEAGSVEAATEALADSPPDLVLADLRFSDHESDRDFSGLAVAKAAADRGIPCIIVTAYPTVQAVRLALRSRGAESWADDFVPKNQGPEPLLDAIRIVLGSREQAPPAEAPPDLEIDLERGLAYRGGEPLALSELQYRLLACLRAHEEGVCSRQELIRAVYDETVTHQQASTDKRLERLVARVRDKIEDDPHNPCHLIKEYGRGFRLIC